MICIVRRSGALKVISQRSRISGRTGIIWGIAPRAWIVTVRTSVSPSSSRPGCALNVSDMVSATAERLALSGGPG